MPVSCCSRSGRQLQHSVMSHCQHKPSSPSVAADTPTIRAPQAYTAILRSPTEYESTPAVSALMQSYFLKLLSRYRDFVELDVVEPPSPTMLPHGAAEGRGDTARAAHRSISHGEDDGGYLRWGYLLRRAARACPGQSIVQQPLLHDSHRGSRCSGGPDGICRKIITGLALCR